MQTARVLLAVVSLLCCIFFSVKKSDVLNTAVYENVQTSSPSSASLPTTDPSARRSAGARSFVSPLIANASSRPTPPFDGLPWNRHRIQFLNERHEYLMTAPTKAQLCYRKQLFVSVIVRASAIEFRDAIRRTWATEIPDPVVLRFFVCGTDVHEQPHLFEENRRHGDMVFCDLPDEYIKLYLKVHASMQWQQAHCSQAQFWLKVDDDVVVHLPRLLYWINEDFRPNVASYRKAIFGAFQTGQVRQMVLYRAVSVSHELYPHYYYPKYASGPCYMMTNAAVSAILDGASSTNGFHLEDALYTGVIASNVGVEKFSRRRLFHKEDALSDSTSCDSNDVPYSTAVYMEGDDKANRMGVLWNRLQSLRCYGLLWRILLFWK